MDTRETIAQLIDQKLDGDCGYGVGAYLADALMPLVARIQAETLREFADELTITEPDDGAAFPDAFLNGMDYGADEAMRQARARADRQENPT